MSNKDKNKKITIFAIISIGIVVLSAWFLKDAQFDVLNPKGIIAKEESKLIIKAVLLMLIVAIPMWVTAYLFAWKYNVANKPAIYSPDEDQNNKLQFVWWALPILVIIVLATITWKGTHRLDPYKPLHAAASPITIQVIALQWKWLFIYPEHDIATVNFLQIPEKTPINFELTADAPMSSFWIPQLGGQIYAMSGMATKSHLMADETGEFQGYAAEINGKGFSGMKFVTKSTSQNEFDAWVKSTSSKSETIDWNEYEKLSKPTENHPQIFYGSADRELFGKVMMKFMPASNNSHKAH
jgi:cytochrome o ubiquinol oxidase subunit 2